MKAVILSFLLGFAFGQDQCVYQSQDGRYTLNLTEISRWTLELETPDHFYYYTPCRNGVNCNQGNAQYHANTAQYKQGVNQCDHFLSVDHHERPSYSFIGGSWIFSYEDGELCQQTNQPRKTNIYYHCDAEQQSRARITAVDEPNICEYAVSIASPLACVETNDHNANCQWRVPDNNGGYYNLDLSQFKDTVIHNPWQNGYEFYYSPCGNNLHCYQQYPYPVMSQIDNRATGTCEHYLAVWEEGRVQPLYHDSDPDAIHWSFHYWNGEPCSNGAQGEERIRWFCDSTVDTYKVLNSTSEGPCRFVMDIASKAACPTSDLSWK